MDTSPRNLRRRCLTMLKKVVCFTDDRYLKYIYIVKIFAYKHHIISDFLSDGSCLHT